MHNNRHINKYSIQDFKIRLSYESLACAFGNNDNMGVGSLFHAFLYNYLMIYGI